MLGSLSRLVDRFVRVLLAALLALMVLCVTWQIVSRYVLDNPSSWTEELARFLLIWIGLIGGAFAYHTGMHLGLDLLADRLTGRAKQLQRYAVHLLVMAFAAAALIGGGIELVRLTLELSQYSPALGIPMAVVYSGVPLSGVLFVYYAALAIKNDSDGPRTPTEI